MGTSTSSSSINRTLARRVAEAFRSKLRPDAVVQELDLRKHQSGLYNYDRELKDGPPKVAQDFLDAIAASDALVISFAEHNWSYTAAWKNLFDWASRIDRNVFQGKPALYFAASPGPGGASEVLAHAVKFAPRHGARLVGAISVAKYDPALGDGDAVFTDAERNARLEASFAKLDAALNFQVPGDAHE